MRYLVKAVAGWQWNTATVGGYVDDIAALGIGHAGWRTGGITRRDAAVAAGIIDLSD